MAYEFRLPDLGEGLTEGEVARWLVEEGQEIAEDDPLVEVQTDKATVEIPSPAAGKVARILVAEGEVVPVGTVLVVIGDEDGVAARAAPEVKKLGLAQAPPAPPRPKGAPVRATPLVRRIAGELGVDLATVAGTGPQGRVTEEDVRRAATSEESWRGPEGLPRGNVSEDAAPPVPRRGEQSLEQKAHESVTESRRGPDSSRGDVSEGRRIPLRGTRRVIAEHMARAHREVPPVTWVEECDFGGIELERLVATLLRACALSLQEYPELNARLEDAEIVELERYDLGVAVQTEQGLVVPVVRGCEARSIEELDTEVRRLADAARAGKLTPEELRGSTFTVTSAGKLGGLLQTPIVNHPEVAILSVGRIGPRPVVRDGEVVPRPVGMISITFDHRVVDGARAAEFGLAVIGRLEQG
jgi:pyruvate/2-oxoglutarate dehydrogenase complex dihydrolipoamide acyltransferase (E2) component